MKDSNRQKQLLSISKDFASMYYVGSSDAVPKMVDLIFNNKYGIKPAWDKDASIEITFSALMMWYTIPMRNIFNKIEADFITEDVIKNVTKAIKLDPVIFRTNFDGFIRFFDEYFSDLENHRAGDFLIYGLTKNKKASYDEEFMPLRLQFENILLKSYPFDWTKFRV